jgi:hypothetical protein
MDASTNSRFAPVCAASFATLGIKKMKIITTFAILLGAVGSVFADIAPPPSSGLVVTGAWHFVHADGTITNGTWTHENVDNVHLMTKEPQKYAKQTGKTGLIVQWWDRERKRRCTIAEYREGKENGYWVHWHPSGELQSCGILKDDRHLTGSFWHTNGMPAEINISTNWFNWDPDGTREGESPTTKSTLSSEAAPSAAPSER